MAHSLFYYTAFFRRFFVAFISLDIAWKDLNIARMVQVNQLFTFCCLYSDDIKLCANEQKCKQYVGKYSQNHLQYIYCERFLLRLSVDKPV